MTPEKEWSTDENDRKVYRMVRNAALEEAAKVAERMGAHWIEEAPDQYSAAKQIAAAIRALAIDKGEKE